jgi:hypothetical protein
MAGAEPLQQMNPDLMWQMLPRVPGRRFGIATFLEMTTWLAARGSRIGLLGPLAFDHWTKLLVQADGVFVGPRARGSNNGAA